MVTPAAVRPLGDHLVSLLPLGRREPGQLEQRLPRALPRAGPEPEGGRLHQLHIPAPGVREGRVSGTPPHENTYDEEWGIASHHTPMKCVKDPMGGLANPGKS